MQPLIATTTTGFLLTLEGISYVMQWVGPMLKVTGPNVCYYVLETARGIEQADCTLKALSILVSN